MGRVIRSAAVLAIAVLSPAAMAAGNFEFIVPGEPGLSLTVRGYAADGTQMFETTPGSAEQRDGESVYVVRVDETIIFSTRLNRWCVEDTSSSWSALAGHVGGATTLCDDNPSETRGSYRFKPLVALDPPSPALEMPAADAASCIQRELNALGFDAGPVDGQMGRRTMNAALDFAGAQVGAVYPALSAETATAWCTQLEAALADGSARGADAIFARFRFGPDIAAPTIAETQAAMRDVDQYFRGVFGEALRVPGTVFVSADADWLADNYVAHLKVGKAIRPGKVEWFAGCHGGEAGYSFIFMCSESDVFSGDWFGAGPIGQKAFALAHEYFHMLQYERAVGRLDGRYDGNTLDTLGPQWLVEGAAEYVAFRVLGDSGRMDFKREIEWHTLKAGEVGRPLKEMEKREGFYAEPRASSAGMIAAHMLAQAAGLEALARFYDEMGSGKDWKSAFSDTFGVPPSVFYEDYEALIR